MFARGSAPVYDEPPFAAMLATSVPWPRPSPLEFVPAETKFTWVRSLEPNSLRLWTPESTTAIAGYVVPAGGVLQLLAPAAAGQAWLFEYASAAVLASRVIERMPRRSARRSI